ncbi:MAG: 16S rRNA (guanine966-N2)-methyltransferase [Candidatus Latescibacterota bacterium]
MRCDSVTENNKKLKNDKRKQWVDFLPAAFFFGVSGMRIVSGKLGGRHLDFNNRRQGNARVTSGMVKEAVFSSLGDLNGLQFLDLFSCSGQIGLEAYSRGAVVVMNEKDRRRHMFIRQTLKEWELQNEIRVYNRPAERLLSELAAEGKVFDVVYLDPPYHEKIDGVPMAVAFLDRVVISGFLSEDARVMVQHDVRVVLEGVVGGLAIVRQKKYGDSVVTMYGR